MTSRLLTSVALIGLSLKSDRPIAGSLFTDHSANRALNEAIRPSKFSPAVTARREAHSIANGIPKQMSSPRSVALTTVPASGVAISRQSC